jgi:hypothetical protein
MSLGMSEIDLLNYNELLYFFGCTQNVLHIRAPQLIARRVEWAIIYVFSKFFFAFFIFGEKGPPVDLRFSAP